MGFTDNWQVAKIFNWQLTFVMRFYWQLTKDRIALNILKTGCKIRTVDLFCPIKVRFLLHIGSTPESHISFIITAWTIHSKVVCHTHFGDIILDTQLNLRDGLILKAVVSFYPIDSEMAFERYRSRMPIKLGNHMISSTIWNK